MKNKRIYTYKAVEDYLTKNDLWECTTIVPGALVDNYFVYHDNAIEVFEECYLNAWSSGIVRHIYRKGLPKRFTAMLEEYEQYEQGGAI